MTPLSHELRLFSTPWHWIVHGLGLGQNCTGFDAARAARIRALDQAVVQRHGEAFPRFVAELVDVILAATDPSDGGERAGAVCARICERIAALTDVGERPRACAVATESLVKLGRLPPDDAGLRGQLAWVLAQLAALSADGDQARYAKLHALINLLVAAAQAGWAELLQPGYRDAGTRLVAEIGDFFYHVRAAAIWQSVLAVLEPGSRGARCAALRCLLDRIDWQLAHVDDRACDGMHEGRDFKAFPLFVTLAALGATRCHELLVYRRRWLEVACTELEALSPRSRASQTLFFVAALRELGALDRHVLDGPALVRDTALRYLGSRDGQQLDDYLRCTYLVHLARQLGCPAALPRPIGWVLLSSPGQLGNPDRFRTSAYGSPLMLVGYLLSAMHTGHWTTEELQSVDLAAIVLAAPPRGDDMVNLPRLGMSLIDAALSLRTDGSFDTALFAALAS